MLEHALEHLRRWRRIAGLDGETDIAAYDIGWSAVDPRHLHAQSAPELSQPPQMRGEPGETRFQQHNFQIGKLAEHALAYQRGKRGLKGGGLRGVILGVIAWPTE